MRTQHFGLPCEPHCYLVLYAHCMWNNVFLCMYGEKIPIPTLKTLGASIQNVVTWDQVSWKRKLSTIYPIYTGYKQHTLYSFSSYIINYSLQSLMPSPEAIFSNTAQLSALYNTLVWTSKSHPGRHSYRRHREIIGSLWGTCKDWRNSVL